VTPSGGGRRHTTTPDPRDLPAVAAGPARQTAAVAITHLQLLSVPVSDQDRARDFYVDVLGFELVRDNHMGPAQRWVQVAPRGGQTSLTLVTWFPSMPAGSLRGLVLETDDIEAEVAAMRERGLELGDGIQTQPWGRFVTITDPDGNGLVVQETTARF
jgi:catechol 2,3-dioxygenase-like lactoylglutathione lyase family enzyme